MKPPTSARAIDTLLEYEEQNGKQKKKKERSREWDSNPVTLDNNNDDDNF